MTDTVISSLSLSIGLINFVAAKVCAHQTHYTWHLFWHRITCTNLYAILHLPVVLIESDIALRLLGQHGEQLVSSEMKSLDFIIVPLTIIVWQFLTRRCTTEKCHVTLKFGSFENLKIVKTPENKKAEIKEASLWVVPIELNISALSEISFFDDVSATFILCTLFHSYRLQQIFRSEASSAWKWRIITCARSYATTCITCARSYCLHPVWLIKGSAHGLTFMHSHRIVNTGPRDRGTHWCRQLSNFQARFPLNVLDIQSSLATPTTCRSLQPLWTTLWLRKISWNPSLGATMPTEDVLKENVAMPSGVLRSDKKRTLIYRTAAVFKYITLDPHSWTVL